MSQPAVPLEEEGPVREPPGPLPPGIRQDAELSRSEVPSIDDVSYDAFTPPFDKNGRTCHPYRRFAASDSASDADSPFTRSRREWLDLQIDSSSAPESSKRPHAARRLLQSKRSASTTCGSRNPDSLGRPACDGSVSRFTNPLPRARLRPMPTRLAPRRHRSRSPVAVRRSAVADPFISELPMV